MPEGDLMFAVTAAFGRSDGCHSRVSSVSGRARRNGGGGMKGARADLHVRRAQDHQP